MSMMEAGDEVDALRMSQADYARYRGLSRARVSQLVSSGRIDVDANGKIDAAAADMILGETRTRVDEPRGENPALAAGLTKARAAHVAVQARRAHLEYQERAGEVVPTAQVSASAAACGEVVVRLIQGLSGRADDLAAAAIKDGVAGVRSALRAIERELRQRISEEFAAMGSRAAQRVRAAATTGDAEISDDEDDGSSVYT